MSHVLWHVMQLIGAVAVATFRVIQLREISRDKVAHVSLHLLTQIW